MTDRTGRRRRHKRHKVRTRMRRSEVRGVQLLVELFAAESPLSQMQPCEFLSAPRRHVLQFIGGRRNGQFMEVESDPGPVFRCAINPFDCSFAEAAEAAGKAAVLLPPQLVYLREGLRDNGEVCVHRFRFDRQVGLTLRQSLDFAGRRN